MYAYCGNREVCLPLRKWMRYYMHVTFIVNGVPKMNLTKEQWDAL